MKKLLLALLLCASPAAAQFATTTTTAPSGDSSTRIADTAFVQTAIPLAAITALSGNVVATGPGVAVATIQPGVVTGSMIAATTITAANIVSGTITGTQVASNTIANSNLVNMVAATLKCNPTSSAAAPQDCAPITVNPVWWGADPTGVSDSTAAFNLAKAAGNVIEFPAGKFRFNSALSYTLPNSLSSVTIKGQGQDNTILFWPNAAGGLTINYAATNYLSSAHIRDLSFTTGQAAGGTALTLTGNALTLATTDLYRVSFRGDDGYNVTDYWTAAIADNFVSNVNLDGVSVTGQGTLTGATTNLHGTGVSLIGNPSGSQYAVQINVAKSFFQALNVGIQWSSFVQGITVDQTNFTGVASGIIAPGGGTGNLSQLSVTNSQFGLYNTGGSNAIFASTQILNATIANNFFFVNSTAASANGVNLTNNCHFNVYGNQFASQGVANGAIAIYANTPCAGGAGVIANNDIFAWTFGIDLDTASKNVTVIGNSLEANTTAIANAGTNNVIVSNPGYNPVGTSASTSMGTSPFTVTAGAAPETHYVLAVGTISSITKGTRTIATAGSTTIPITIELGPYESYITTWATTAPTFVRDIH